MKMVDDFLNTMVAHELNGSANFRLRDKFYKQITKITPAQKIALKPLLSNLPGGSFEPITEPSILKSDVTEAQSKAFMESGYLYPLELRDEYLDRIYEAAENLKFTNKISGGKIYLSEINQELLKSGDLDTVEGTYWLYGGTTENQELISSDIMQRLAFDPFILNSVAKYLGSTPIHVATNMWLSGPAKNPAEVSANAQEYHQDCGFSQFVKVFVYLSDTSIDTGAHAFIRGSCLSDPDKMFEDYTNSERLSEQQLKKKYKAKDFSTITGNRGTITLGDTSCFHKGLPVEKGSRLILNLEYTSSLFGSSVPYFNSIPKREYLGTSDNLIAKRICMNYEPGKFEEYLNYNSKWKSRIRRMKNKIQSSIGIY